MKIKALLKLDQQKTLFNSLSFDIDFIQNYAIFKL